MSISVIRKIFNEFYNAGCFRQAGALSYATLFAIVPILVVCFFVLTLFPSFSDLTLEIEKVVFSNLIASAALNVQQYLNVCIDQAQHLPVWGVLTLFVTAVLLFVSVEQAFNDIWHVKKSRHGIIAFFLYMVVLILLPIFVGVFYIASSYLTRLSFFEMDMAHSMLFFLMPRLAIFAAFALLYALLPNCKVRFKAVIWGSLVATILLEIAKQGFTAYITKFANYKLIYGALSLIPTFLVWLYVFWIILLFGVVISYVVTKNTKEYIVNN